MTELNWRRGLFRLWAVLAACWWLFSLVVVVMSGWPARSNDSDTLLFAFLAPFFVFVIGRGAAWAYRWIAAGFKSTQSIKPQTEWEKRPPLKVR